MHRHTLMVVVAICLSVLLIVTIAGCSSSDNSDGNPNDGNGMMNNGGSNGTQDGGMMNPVGSADATSAP